MENIKQISEDCYKKPIDKDTIQYVFNAYMRKIKDRQKEWDIDVYEYIQRNYKKTKLFYDPGHPTNEEIKHIASQVLTKLSISPSVTEIEHTMDMHEMPVCPYVKEELELNWKDDHIRRGNDAKKLKSHMDFDEYIIEYTWWKYELLKEQIVRRIKNYIEKHGVNRFVIAPYGACGRIIDRIISEDAALGSVLCRIDNRSYDNKRTHPVDYLNDGEQFTFIASTMKNDIDHEICCQLKMSFPKHDIIHVLQGWCEF